MAARRGSGAVCNALVVARRGFAAARIAVARIAVVAARIAVAAARIAVAAAHIAVARIVFAAARTRSRGPVFSSSPRTSSLVGFAYLPVR